ncbi:hypothetical protein E3Q18_01280 [Wallemia mellicola]|nr:hypothetical protein E3Q18_01280 [Wallemia mellicola]
MRNVSVPLCDEIDTEDSLVQEQRQIKSPVEPLPSLLLSERPTDKQFKPQYQERYTETSLERRSQMTIEQSFEMSASRKRPGKEHVETLKICIDDGEKTKNRNKASNESKQVCKPVLPVKNVSKQSTKKRRTPTFWTTFNKLPKIEAIKTERQPNTSKNSLINPTDNAIVTPEKKVRMFEPTSLDSHKEHVDQIGGSNNAWKTAIFSNKYSAGIQ